VVNASVRVSLCVCVCSTGRCVDVFVSMHSVALSLFCDRACTTYRRKLHKLRSRGSKVAPVEWFPDDDSLATLAVSAAALDVTAADVDDAGTELTAIRVQSLPLQSSDTVRSLTSLTDVLSAPALFILQPVLD
jgi:hypothetical protein